MFKADYNNTFMLSNSVFLKKNWFIPISSCFLGFFHFIDLSLVSLISLLCERHCYFVLQNAILFTHYFS